MKRNTIDIITLGCSKNLVDSEKLMRQLEANGYKVTHDSDKPQGEIAVINTCGFIGDAKEESINMILEFCQAKEEGKLKKLYVMGCLSERYLKELALEIPQVDKFYGKFNWNELLADLGKAYKSEFAIERTLTTPHHYAYLKISEGCDRKCSYCAIPIITGRHVSRPMEEILDEVKYLVARGVKEFQVEVTGYPGETVTAAVAGPDGKVQAIKKDFDGPQFFTLKRDTANREIWSVTLKDVVEDVQLRFIEPLNSVFAVTPGNLLRSGK